MPLLSGGGGGHQGSPGPAAGWGKNFQGGGGGLTYLQFSLILDQNYFLDTGIDRSITAMQYTT